MSGTSITTINEREKHILQDSKFADIAKNDLQDLFKEQNLKARQAARKSLEHVRTAGEILICIKSKLSHGMWIRELDLLGINRRTASNYMRIATEWETVSHLNGGVKDALKLITRVDNPPQTNTPTPDIEAEPPMVVDAEVVEDEPETLIVDATKNKPPVKSECISMCLNDNKTLEDYLMAELVKIDPEWATVDADYLNKIKAEGTSSDQINLVRNLIYELWILKPAVRAEILTGINTLQPINL